MRAITCHVILTSLRTRTDGSLGLSISTPELTSAEKTAWLDLQGKNCKILLEPEDVSEPPIEVKAPLDSKTPSQRLRAVLFLFWQQEGSVGDFSLFYQAKINQFIESVKSKLDPP